MGSEEGREWEENLDGSATLSPCSPRLYFNKYIP